MNSPFDALLVLLLVKVRHSGGPVHDLAEGQRQGHVEQDEREEKCKSVKFSLLVLIF